MSDKLEALKKQATELGISYAASIGEATLEQRIKDKLAEESVSSTGLKEEDNRRLPINKQLRQEALKLERVIVTCLDPMYAKYPSQLFQVGNRVIGTIKKVVPFGREFHVPTALLKQIENETFNRVEVINDGSNGGAGRNELKAVPRYGVKRLPPLTEKELADLNSALKASK